MKLARLDRSLFQSFVMGRLNRDHTRMATGCVLGVYEEFQLFDLIRLRDCGYPASEARSLTFSREDSNLIRYSKVVLLRIFL